MSKKRNRDQRFDSSSDIEQALDDLDELVGSFTSSDSDDEFVSSENSSAENIPMTPLVDDVVDDEDDGPTLGERLKAWFDRIRFAEIFGVLTRKGRSLAVAVGSVVQTGGRKIYNGLRSLGSVFASKAGAADDETLLVEDAVPAAAPPEVAVANKKPVSSTGSETKADAAGSVVDYDDEDEDRFRWIGLGIKTAALAGILLLVGGGYFGVKAFFKPSETAQVDGETESGSGALDADPVPVDPASNDTKPAAPNSATQPETPSVAPVRPKITAPATTPSWATAPAPPVETAATTTSSTATDPQNGGPVLEAAPEATPASPTEKTASDIFAVSPISENDPYATNPAINSVGNDPFSAPLLETAATPTGGDVFLGFGAPEPMETSSAAPSADPWGATALDTTAIASSTPATSDASPASNLVGSSTDFGTPATDTGPDLFGAAPLAVAAPATSHESPAFALQDESPITSAASSFDSSDPFAALQNSATSTTTSNRDMSLGSPVESVTPAAPLESLTALSEMGATTAAPLVSVLDQTPSIPHSAEVTSLASTPVMEPLTVAEPAVQIPDDHFAALTANASSANFSVVAPLGPEPAVHPLTSQPEITPIIPNSGDVELLAGPVSMNSYTRESAPVILEEPVPTAAPPGDSIAFGAPAPALEAFIAPQPVVPAMAQTPVMELPAIAAVVAEPTPSLLMNFSVSQPSVDESPRFATATPVVGTSTPLIVPENQLAPLSEQTFGQALQNGVNELRNTAPPQTPNLRLQRDSTVEVASAPAAGQKSARLFQADQASAAEFRPMSMPANPNDPSSNQLFDLLPGSGGAEIISVSNVGQIVPADDEAPLPSFAGVGGKYRVSTRRDVGPSEIREGEQPRRMGDGAQGGARSFRQLFSEEAKNSPAETRQYTVREGDTYLTICEKEYDTTLLYTALAVHNRQRGATWKPTPGTVIELPPADFLRTNYEEVLSRSRNHGTYRRTSQSNVRVPAIGAQQGTRYVAQEGDTIFKIAMDRLRDSNRWQEVLALNTDKVRSAYEPLPAGTEIQLPTR